jgi:hypothetical protein
MDSKEQFGKTIPNEAEADKQQIELAKMMPQLIFLHEL